MLRSEAACATGLVSNRLTSASSDTFSLLSGHSFRVVARSHSARQLLAHFSDGILVHLSCFSFVKAISLVFKSKYRRAF